MNTRLENVFLENGFLCTKLTASYLNDDMGKTNGCGSGFLSHWASRSITWFVGVDLTPICDLHDKAYMIPLEERSQAHKKAEDENFEKNIRRAIIRGELNMPRWIKNMRWYRRMRNRIILALPDLYHASVTIGGAKSYNAIT